MTGRWSAEFGNWGWVPAFPPLLRKNGGTRGRADCCIANAQRKTYSVFDAALGEDAFLVGVFDFAHFGDGVGEFD